MTRKLRLALTVVALILSCGTATADLNATDEATLSKHVLGTEMKLPEHDPFLEEHLHVFDALIEQKPTSAAEALKRHIRSSCPKVIERVEAFREIFTPPDIDYIS